MDETTMSNQVIRCVMTMPDEEFAVLSVGKLANLLNIDRYKLSRQFKRQTEMTLEEFLYKEKMNRAAILLLDYRDISVKDVSEKIGFCSPDYFIRKFKQFYGIVPGKYRDYKTTHTGIEDRREGLKDRRQIVDESKILETGERRKGFKDPGQGEKDRRKRNCNYEYHINSRSVPQNLLTIRDNKHGNLCENCYFRLFALNFDDLK